MRKILVAGVICTGIGIPLLSQPSAQAIKSDCVEFKNYKNFYNEYLLKYDEVQIQKEIQRQLEEERLRQEELERIRLAEIEANRVITYNPYNLLEPSNINRDEAYRILEGTKLQTLSNAYVYMEELYGINAIYLMSLSGEESGWGGSNLAMSHNNIGGIKSSDGGWRYFNSWGDCLDYKARLLKNQYLTEDGDYYNGLSIWNVNVRYCEGTQWAENINQIANDLLRKLK